MTRLIRSFFAKSASAPLPRGVWALGFVSLWMDISSEMIHALLPVYLVTGMGASMVMVGMIEGIAEATAAVTKLFSGAISDWIGRRKPLAVLGYGLAALTKPVFPLAPTVGWLLAARFTDRVGKGIRGAPRDALVADMVAPEQRGAAFGLRQALDTVGAFVGPLAAVALMWLFHDDIPVVFWFAALPAGVSVFILITRVPEPEHHKAATRGEQPFRAGATHGLGGAFWAVTAVAGLFTLARFSEAFLILKASDAGVGAGFVPLVLVILNLSYAVSAYPAGVISDRTGRLGVLAIGAGLLFAADLVLAFGQGKAALGLGLFLWGLHMGFTQGAFAALVADCAPREKRGTAFGILHLSTGIALLLASLAAGALWEVFGAGATFGAGAVLSLATLATLGPLAKRLRTPASG